MHNQLQELKTALQLPVKPKQLIDIITQSQQITAMYQASTGQILQQQISEIEEPYSKLLQQVLLNQSQLEILFISNTLNSPEVIFTFCLILMTKNNAQMQEFTKSFMFNGLDLFQTLNSVIFNQKVRRIFVALGAGFRSQSQELENTAELNESSQEEDIFNLLILVLCSFSKQQICKVNDKLNIKQMISQIADKEVQFVFDLLLGGLLTTFEGRLVEISLKESELIKKQRLGMILTYLKGFQFKQLLGEADFQESQQTYEYEVLYQLWQ